jgi:predicted nucleic acid-binding protein
VTAVDTNVVVRVPVNDDADQSPRAAKLLSGERVLLRTTVLPESEWVLRYAYELDRTAISGAFRKLLGLPTVTPEDASAAVEALRWYDEGLELADALHLATAGEAGAGRFATFDRALATRGRRLHAGEMVEP